MILLTEQDEIGNSERFELQEMLERTTFDISQRKQIEAQINECGTLQEFEELQHHLWLNMIQDRDRIAMGLPYNQTDIKKALRKVL